MPGASRVIASAAPSEVTLGWREEAMTDELASGGTSTGCTVALAPAPLEPGGDDRQLLDRLARVRAAVEAVREMILDEARGQLPRPQRRVGEQRPEEGQVVRDALDPVAGDRLAHRLDRRLPGRRPGDELGDHRVVVHRDLAAGVDAGVDADEGRRGVVRHGVPQVPRIGGLADRRRLVGGLGFAPPGGEGDDVGHPRARGRAARSG